MSDDEAEMALLRRNQRFQMAKPPVVEEAEQSAHFNVKKEEVDNDYNDNNNQDAVMQRYKDELMRQYQERENANGFSLASMNTEDKVEQMDKISFGRKRQKTPQQTIAASSKATQEEAQRQVHAQHKRQEFSEDVANKIQQAAKSRMDFDRVRPDIYLKHKRGIAANLKKERQADGEIDSPKGAENEADDDMAGPSLALFMPQLSLPEPKKEQNEQYVKESNDQVRKSQLNIPSTDAIEQAEDEASDYQTSGYWVPQSHEVVLEGHNRSVQALAINREGSKMVTGASDYSMKMWDFTTMNRKLKPFKDFKPFDGHPVRSLSFSPSGEHFLCCCGNNQAKLYNAEGVRRKTTVRGDMYIHDMANTKGHVAAINDGKWHPKDENTFATASQDGTVRLWDVNAQLVGIEQQLAHVKLIKARSQQSLSGNSKVSITSLCYSHKGDFIVGGCADGSIQLWDFRENNLYRPSIYLPHAHAPNAEVTAVLGFRDSRRLVSRAMDDSMKIWDLRRTPGSGSSAIATASGKCDQAVLQWDDEDGLFNMNSRTGVTLSPNEKIVLTGTSVRKGYSVAQVAGFSTVTGENICRIPSSAHSVISIVWHPQLNQIFTGSADTTIRVLYDPEKSRGGIMKCVTKQERRKPVEGQTVFGKPILTPALFDDERQRKQEIADGQPGAGNKHRNKDDDSGSFAMSYIPPEFYDPEHMKRKKQKDVKKTLKPEMPLQGPAKGGRTPQSGTLAQYVMQDLYKDNQRDMDPREALLRYDKESVNDPMWVAPAYKNTQPKAVFEKQNEVPRHDNLKFLESAGQDKCSHCGLKFCTCTEKR